MPNATSADVRAGWDVFRGNPSITLDELNRELAATGRGEVHDRTLRHYRALLRAGYERYVSVNRFDVAKASKPYEGASATPRYFYFGVQIPVAMHFDHGDDHLTVDGVAERVGEIGSVITFEADDAVSTLQSTRPRVSTYVRLDLGTPVRDRVLARVIEVDLDDKTVLIEVEFTRLQPVSVLTSASSVSTDASHLLHVGRDRVGPSNL